MAPKRDASHDLEQPAPISKFEPEEEAALLDESNEQKAQANKLFGSSRYSEAIGEYDKALSSCPNYLEYEIAVLRSNIAACHLKLEDWKAATDAASASLDALDRLQPEKSVEKLGDGDGEVVEIAGEGDEAEKELETLKINDERKTDIQRIRAKALMRRAKARSEQGGWSNLQGAEEDYKELAKMPTLPMQDTKIVKTALAALPPRISAAKEKEMGDMMGKLKELGNGILRPFGLSTDNFNMVKDEATGGYNMNFNQGK
ncbi:MAG: hypothetical protein LQ347_001137 [Umbilicaria vellea]|nr:MAG: hypothetical protein LQ347_001137 [Umbilicaria vellea]